MQYWCKVLLGKRFSFPPTRVMLLSLSILNKSVEEEIASVKVESSPGAKVVAECGHGNTALVGLSSLFCRASGTWVFMHSSFYSLNFNSVLELAST